MKVWISKYALSTGVYETEVDEPSPNFPGRVKETRTEERLYPQFFHGLDWHHTEEEARARANVMVANKIKSVKKNLAKFEKMVF